MCNNKGITTTSLMIYVIAMLIVIGIIATITSFFYTNVINLEDNAIEIIKFNMYFLQEIKKENNAIAKLALDSNSTTPNTLDYITFKTGNTFTYKNNSIYYNSNKICGNIKNFSLKVSEIDDKKQLIEVIITIGENTEYTKTTKYVLTK